MASTVIELLEFNISKKLKGKKKERKKREARTKKGQFLLTKLENEGGLVSTEDTLSQGPRQNKVEQRKPCEKFPEIKTKLG